MRINSLRITSFQGFEESGKIFLSSGFNLLVGQNNSGKSSILKALTPFTDQPHRNAKRYRANHSPQSEASVSVIIPGPRILTAWQETGQSLSWETAADGDEAPKDLVTRFFDTHELEFNLSRKSNSEWSAGEPTHGMYVGPTKWSVAFKIDPVNGIDFDTTSAGYDLINFINKAWREDFFYFDAQRYSLGRSSFSIPDRLDSTASNLPQILLRLFAERRKSFAQLERHMNEIFPSVQAISVAPDAPTGGVEVRIWPTENQDAPELAIPLNDCGTGIAQALAILTAAITLEEAVIAIDEIGSFLHPAASKALVRILQTHYNHHQYIVTTHSTEILHVANASTVHMIRKEGFESKVEKIEVDKLENLQAIASELGISMSDVLAADHIVWVEGPTEEACFDLIFKSNFVAEGIPPRFISLIATGDVAGKGTRKNLILGIYHKLSSAAQPLIQQVSFGFDREKLSEQDVRDIERSDGKRIRFLKRRLLECYLVDIAAIEHVINAELNLVKEAPIKRSQIQSWLYDHGRDRKYEANSFSGDYRDINWLKAVDAAKLLHDLFAYVTDGRLEYRKTKHSKEILAFLVDVCSPDIQELIEFVEDLVGMSGAKSRLAK